MKRNRRICCILLCLVIVVTMLTSNKPVASAAENTTVIHLNTENSFDNVDSENWISNYNYKIPYNLIFIINLLKKIPTEYVALGDSIATGYGLLGYSVGTTPENAYVSVVGAALGGRWQNLAVDGLTSSQLLDELYILPQKQLNILSQAKIITISIGSNDVLKPFTEIIADKLDCDVNKIQSKLADLVKNNLIGLAQFLVTLDAKDGTGLRNNPKLLKATTAFPVNFQKIIARIKELAPNANIIVTNAYNPYEGVTLNYVLGSLNLGEITDTYIQELNKAFTANSTDYKLIDVYSVFSDSYKNGVSPVNVNVSPLNFDPHPNAIGHKLIADEILNKSMLCFK